MAWRLGWTCWGLTLAWLGVSCGGKAVIDGDPQAVDCSPADCSCFGEPIEGSTSLRSVTVHLQAQDLFAKSPAGAGLTFEGCARDDDACATPLGSAVTDDRGRFDATIPLGEKGWCGYVRHDQQAGFVKGVEFAYPCYVPNPETRYYRLTLLQDGVIAGTANALGVESDPSKTIMTGYVYDCSGVRMPGVVIEVSSDAIGYTRDAVPVIDAGGTDDDGLFFAINVPPGRRTVTAKLADGGEVMATASDILFEAGGHTHLNIHRWHKSLE